jgi:hypothetical protein
MPLDVATKRNCFPQLSRRLVLLFETLSGSLLNLGSGEPMAFEPDILITTPEGIALVVEAKVSLQNLARSEDELKHYMVRMQCPIGLLITPEHMWLYRDFYTVDSATSVQRVGEFDVAKLWHQKPPLQGAAFEGFVQQWLEDLVAEYPNRELPGELNEALGRYIVPAVATGDMRAAHVRY